MCVGEGEGGEEACEVVGSIERTPALNQTGMCEGGRYICMMDVH